MVDNVHFTSRSGDWETPPELIARLKTAFPFDLDVCASRPNVCERFYSPEDDGLSKPWDGLCWMNAPYGKGRKIDRWMQKARLEGAASGTTVVCLPPARTSTRWWQDNVPFASLCVFIRGRLRFVERSIERNRETIRCHPAPFPSALVVFGDLSLDQMVLLATYGMTVFPARSTAETLFAASISGQPRQELLERSPVSSRDQPG